MSFRSGGQSDARRRRVLIDERAHAGDDSAARTRRNRGTSPGGYTAAARHENQPRVTDFIPRRHFTLSIWLLLGLVTIAGLEALHAESFHWQRSLGATAAPLELNSRGSLASWFSAVTLSIAALLALVVFNLRRHKEDDYRGRYRLWLLFAVLAGLGSLDSVTYLHTTFSRMMVLLTGREIGAGGGLWPAVVFGPLVGWLIFRLTFEFWNCRQYLAILGSALVCYAWAGAIHGNYLKIADPTLHAMTLYAVLLLGHLAVAYLAANYARHVFLDAQGLLGKKARRKAKVAVAKDDATTTESSTAAPAKRTDLNPPAKATSPSPAISPNKAASSANASRDQDDDDEKDSRSAGQGNSLQRFLSKSERKRQQQQASSSQSQQRRAA